MDSKRNVYGRLQRLEEALAPESNAFDCVIEYDEHTTPEEIEAMKAERAARGARVFIMMPKNGGVSRLLLVVPESEVARIHEKR
jgi:hypothetical protein